MLNNYEMPSRKKKKIKAENLIFRSSICILRESKLKNFIYPLPLLESKVL